MILTLQTTTFGAYGGIPTYNRCVCRVLNELMPADRQPVLITSDRDADIEPQAANFNYLSFEGFAGRRAAFATTAVKAALGRKIDLTLIGHINYAPIGLALKKIKPGFNYGVMVHGVEVWSRLPTLKRMALQQADFITSVSEYTKQKIVEMHGVAHERVYVLPNTIEWAEESLKSQVSSLKSQISDLRSSSLSTRPSSNMLAAMPSFTLTTKVRLLSVCRLEASEGYKGIDHVIEALPHVLKVVPNLEYNIIGGGSDLARHQQLAIDLGVSEHVRFLGSVDAGKLRAAYRDCDIFVMPSAGEGFGIVYLEAMQYAKPVVAARSAATPEVVIDNVTGLLVEYANRGQISSALKDLCADVNKRDQLGKAGYKRLQENFTFPRFKDRLTEILLRELPQESEARSSKAVISAPPAATPTQVE